MVDFKQLPEITIDEDSDFVTIFSDPNVIIDSTEGWPYGNTVTKKLFGSHDINTLLYKPQENFNGTFKANIVTFISVGGSLLNETRYFYTIIVRPVDDAARGSVQVDGIAQYGNLLSASISAFDIDGPIQEITYKWQKSPNGLDGWVDISGENGSQLELNKSPKFGGFYIRVCATTTDSLGGKTDFYSPSTNQLEKLISYGPVIISDGGRNSAEISTAENFTFASTIMATDDVVGATLRYSILGGADAGLFSINATTGALSFKSAPNFEAPTDSGANNVYDVIVQVSDGSLTDTQALAVTVTDVVNELLVGTSKTDTLTGAEGNDTLKGSGGNDTLLGNGGNDILDGGKGADRMEGGSGNDIYIVDNTSDVIVETTGSGTDTVKASATHTLTANVENLSLTGSANLGGRGNDSANTIIGNAGSNILMGFAGNDSLKGGVGNDALYGGLGKDVLTGGTGQDFFVFDTAPNAANVDKITDFTSSEGDKVQLSKAVFKGFTHLGSVTGDEFYAAAGATKAHDATDRVIYDTASGKLFYDPDGQGGAGSVQIAVLGSSSHPVMIYSDIQIIA